MLPPSTLLNNTPTVNNATNNQRRTLVEKLKQFGILGKIDRVETGPSLTTYYFRLRPTIKYSAIAAMENDLALALKAKAVKIEIAPGTDTVAVQIARPDRQLVTIRQILEKPEYWRGMGKNYGLRLALGAKANGDPLVVELSDLPHLLVSGATGSGKSIGVHSIMMSLLFRYRSDQLEIGLSDIKRVELAPYGALPHARTYGVAVTPAETIRMLRQVKRNLKQRYEILAEAKVTSITDYRDGLMNRRLDRNKFPYIPLTVIVADELAELMATGGKQVEELIVSIAQVGRAAGVHLVLATQRPVVKVVTGLIKANIPARLAFKTASRIDSLVILDQIGAEKLMGLGDGLFKLPSVVEPIRFQGAFVTTKEVEKVVAYLSQEEQIYATA